MNFLQGIRVIQSVFRRGRKKLASNFDIKIDDGKVESICGNLFFFF